eukprot:497101-Pelagomonas_calceolata.AAC.3
MDGVRARPSTAARGNQRPDSIKLLVQDVSLVARSIVITLLWSKAPFFDPKHEGKTTDEILLFHVLALKHSFLHSLAVG